MKAWMLDEPGRPLALRDVPTPSPRRGAALVRMEAVPLLSYTRSYVEGKLPYTYPPGPFSPGTNGIGRIEAVGEGVHAFEPGQRVLVSPYWVSDEAVPEPPQALLGLTAVGAGGTGLLQAFPHGTWRELAEFPAATLVPLAGLGAHAPERLAVLAKFAVPFGGLRRGSLTAGETVAVNGAGGAFGSAAVLDALALGACRVVAIARNVQRLARIVELGGSRVVPVSLSGDVERDAAAIRDAAQGGIDLAFDMVGQARDANSTLATLMSLRRGGRLVLMGSMQVPLPVPYGEMLRNNWALIGHFMYTRADYLALVALAASGQLPLDAVDVRVFAFGDMEAAIDAASDAGALESVVVSAGARGGWAR